MKTLLIILTSLVCFFTFNLGYDYINFGYGLHPAIAFTVSGACVTFLYFLLHPLEYKYQAPDHSTEY